MRSMDGFVISSSRALHKLSRFHLFTPVIISALEWIYTRTVTCVADLRPCRSLRDDNRLHTPFPTPSIHSDYHNSVNFHQNHLRSKRWFGLLCECRESLADASNGFLLMSAINRIMVGTIPYNWCINQWPKENPSNDAESEDVLVEAVVSLQLNQMRALIHLHTVASIHSSRQHPMQEVYNSLSQSCSQHDRVNVTRVTLKSLRRGEWR